MPDPGPARVQPVRTGSPFPRVDGRLRAGDIDMAELGAEHGTPLFVYDARAIDARYAHVRSAFAGVDLLVAYSVKANGSLAILDRLARLGGGADIVSGGELFRSLRAGIPADRIVFAGVGKTRAEIEEALQAGIHAFHVESRGELELLATVGRDLGLEAPFGIRVNPDIVSPTHEYTRTGHAGSKFGVPTGEAVELYAWAAGQPGLRARGVDVHIGSQIAHPDPFQRALDHVLDLVARLRSEGHRLEYVDLGGGFGIDYAEGGAIDLDALGARVADRVAPTGLRLVVEPGRFIVGEAGVLLTRVLYLKRSGSRDFAITDAGMTELIRPSHYGGAHRIEPVVWSDRPTMQVDVVGPVCETGDFLGRNRELPRPEPGELLAVRESGAYGFAMASNYNGRLRPAEVLVDGSRVHRIRDRETYEDLVRAERVPEPLPETEHAWNTTES